MHVVVAVIQQTCILAITTWSFQRLWSEDVFFGILWITLPVENRDLSTKNVLPNLSQEVTHKGRKIAGQKIVHQIHLFSSIIGGMAEEDKSAEPRTTTKQSTVKKTTAKAESSTSQTPHKRTAAKKPTASTARKRTTKARPPHRKS